MEVNVKIEESFSNNPWYVEDATAFLKFCCPECDYQIPDLQLFSDHAVCNHEKSTVLFGTETTKGQLISNGLFDVIVSTKKTTKFLKDFCPSL